MQPHAQQLAQCICAVACAGAGSGHAAVMDGLRYFISQTEPVLRNWHWAPLLVTLGKDFTERSVTAPDQPADALQAMTARRCMS